MRQYIDTLQDANGNALVGATVLVQNYVGGGNASIFSDNGLTPIANSTVTTGSDGQFAFFAADGDYNLVMSKNATIFKTQTPVSIFDGAAQVTLADSGSANAYVTVSSVLEKALRTGLRSWINIGNSNTGASTYSYNGLAAKAIVNAGGTALTSGQLLAGSIYQLEYNGTAWQLAAPPGPSYFGITAAEKYATATYGTPAPSNLTYAPGNALRYGADPTGVTDSTAALNAWIQHCWAMYGFVDGQGLWSGAGGAVPVLQLPPGKFMLSGTLYVPAACTITGTGHPANTTNHTRLIMTSSSTGLTPGRTWAANATIPAGARINAGNGYNFYSAAGGVSGSSVPAWTTSAGNVTDGTVTWAFNAANTSGDNRNTPIFRFGRGTQPRVGTYPASGPNGVLADSATVFTLQELECWYVAIGAGFSNPLAGNGYAVGDYPLGGTVSLDVDCADCRIVDSVFQACPAAITGTGVSSTSATRGDGFTGNRGIGLFVENCEFDGSSAHVFFSGCYLNVWFKECQFFNTSSFYGSCTGQVQYLDCYFQDGGLIQYPFVDMGQLLGANTFSSVIIKGCVAEPPANTNWVYINSSACLVDITDNSLLVSATQGGIYLVNVGPGKVANNLLNNQGVNNSAGTGPTNFIAAINLQTCTGVAVTANTLCANYTAQPYNGFGIFSYNGSGNYVGGNVVTAPYNGATYNGKGRAINIGASDILGPNFNLHDFATGTSTGPQQVNGTQAVTAGGAQGGFVSPTYGTTVAINVALGNMFEINVANTTAFTIAAPTGNLQAGQMITILIANGSGGTMGTVTWTSGVGGYKLAPWVNPANALDASITFVYEGAGLYWREINRGLTTVPN